MAALTAARNTKQVADTGTSSYPMLNAVTGYQGGIAVMDSAGYIKPGVTGASLIAVGVFSKTADNSAGAAAAINGELREGFFYFANSAGGDAIALDDLGKPCYVVDDQTVALTSNSGARSPCGRIAGYDATLGVLVEINRWMARQIAEEAADTGVNLTIAGVQTVTGEKIFNQDKLGVFNAGGTFHSVFRSSATADRTVTFPDATGTVVLAAVGGAGTFLRSNGTIWTGSTATIPDTFTAGDIVHATAGNVLGSLAAVAAGSVLRSGGVGVISAWSTATYPDAPAAVGDILYASGAGAYGNLTAGAAGKVLRAAGAGVAPAYSTATFPDTATGAGRILRASGANAWAESTATFPDAPAAVGDILYASGAAAYGNLTAGAAGQMLRAAGAGVAPAYSTATFPDTVTGAGNILRASGANVWAESTATYPDAPSAVGDIVVGTGAAAYGHVVDVAVGSVLLSGGVGVVPAYGKAAGTHFATVAYEQTAPGATVCHIFDIGDAAGNTDVVIDDKFEVFEIVVKKTSGAGGAGDTVQIVNSGVGDISDAISLNVAQHAVARCATINQTNSVIAAAGTLRATIVDGNAGATDLSCRVFIHGAKLA